MKYLKLYENYKEEDIHAICKKYGITNYSINGDVIDVDGDVDLSYKNLEKLPLKFGVVTGNFYCYNNKLTKLEGCPIYVGGSLSCGNNNLTSLEGCSEKVNNGFYCYINNLTSLEGCPLNLQGSFNCNDNQLTSLMNGPKYVGDQFLCCNNKLTSLEGCSSEVSYLECYGNPIYEIYKLFPNHQSFKDSLDYNYFRIGNKINKIRLTQALEEIKLNFGYIGYGVCPENIEGYIWE